MIEMSRKLFFLLGQLVYLFLLLCLTNNSACVSNEADVNEGVLVNGVHDIAIIDVSVSPDEVIEGKENNIQVMVRNEGDYPERFNVTVTANQTIFIDSYLVTTLGPLDQIVIPFVWTTAGIDGGNYTIGVEADVVEGETDIADNTRTSSSIRIVGDDTAPVIGVPIQDPPSDFVMDYDPVTVSVGIIDTGSGVHIVIVSWKINLETRWRNKTLTHQGGRHV